MQVGLVYQIAFVYAAEPGTGCGNVSPSATTALPDRMAMLQAWEEPYNLLGASGRGVFLAQAPWEAQHQVQVSNFSAEPPVYITLIVR